MTIREVRLFGDPVLNTRADEVTQFDDALKTLVEDMLDTMDEYDGVGSCCQPGGGDTSECSLLTAPMRTQECGGM